MFMLNFQGPLKDFANEDCCKSDEIILEPTECGIWTPSFWLKPPGTFQARAPHGNIATHRNTLQQIATYRNFRTSAICKRLKRVHEGSSWGTYFLNFFETSTSPVNAFFGQWSLCPTSSVKPTFWADASCKCDHFLIAPILRGQKTVPGAALSQTTSITSSTTSITTIITIILIIIFIPIIPTISF